ncbi:MAG: bifunctional DNA-formamidopyrimidine glycosylase/DNA-(apurinic or apyrimidinic site) lyase [Planctomycetaceae bacterium]
MPELPEVETMVRGIRPSVEGRRIVALRRCACRCRPISIRPALAALARRCEGRVIAGVRRRAKRIVLDLDSGEAIVIEPRMTGLMLVADPPDREHLRLEWVLDGPRRPGRLWFWDRRGLGTVRLLAPAEVRALSGVGALGRDALEMTLDDWRELCARTRRPVKVALLDQKLVAGIGNLYASEILHLAGIDPRAPATRLRKGRLARLAAAAAQVLAEAIRYEGSTLKDGTYRNALSESGGYQNAHRVYDREGAPCPTCAKGVIRRFVQAQRATFYCPRCQR